MGMNQYIKIFVALLLGMHSAVRAEPVVGSEATAVQAQAPTDPLLSKVLMPNSLGDGDLKNFPAPDPIVSSIHEESNGVKITNSIKIRRTVFDESLLNYQCSKNFCVWWDKRFDHAENSADTLKWAEKVFGMCVDNGMRTPVGSSEYYINIYLHHLSRDGGGDDVLPEDFGQGVGTEYGMPFYSAPYPKDRIVPNPKKPYGDLIHEVFHICQYNRRNYSYEVPTSAWYIEATASWIQFKLLPYDDVIYPDWYQGFYAAETLNMQPQLSMWGGISEIDGTWKSWSYGVHRYGMHIMLTYLDRIGYLSDRYIYESFNSDVSSGKPQRDIYDMVFNFTEVYRKFALNMVSLDFLTPKERDGFKQLSNWWDENIERLDGTGDFKNDFNRYVAVLKDSGTQGYISPAEKNQAWSWTVIKIENTAAASYEIKFDGDLVGNNGTKSDFYVGTFMEGVAQRYGEIPLNNQKGSGAVSVPKNTTAYVVVVNTPYSFEGSEAFNYKIKIERTAESVTYPIAVKTNGSGVVVSNPAGINCGSICTATFTGGTSVSLTASPTDGHGFNGWGGACSGTGACVVTMDSAKNVTATFTAIAPPPVTYALAVNKAGSGTVTSTPAGINCGATCSASFPGGASVTLTASPTAGHSFNGWSGACSGVGACSVTMDAAKSVTATFTENGLGPPDPFDPNKPDVKSIIPSSLAIVKRPFTIGWQLNQIQSKMPVRVKFAKDGVAYRVIKSAKANATGIGSYLWKPTKAHRTENGLLQICAVPSKGVAEVCSPKTTITVQ
jgi:hypothetical protein